MAPEKLSIASLYFVKKLPFCPRSSRMRMVHKTAIILVAPDWQAQHWSPVRLKLLISQLVLLTNNPRDLKRVHPMYHRLHLAVFEISTDVDKVTAFHDTLPNYLSLRLVLQHTKLMNQSMNRWCRWYSRREIFPLHISSNHILVFLTEAFNEGLAYR